MQGSPDTGPLKPRNPFSSHPQSACGGRTSRATRRAEALTSILKIEFDSRTGAGAEALTLRKPPLAGYRNTSSVTCPEYEARLSGL